VKFSFLQTIKYTKELHHDIQVITNNIFLTDVSAGCHKTERKKNEMANELNSTVPQLMCPPLGNNVSELPATVFKQTY